MLILLVVMILLVVVMIWVLKAHIDGQVETLSEIDRCLNKRVDSLLEMNKDIYELISELKGR